MDKKGLQTVISTAKARKDNKVQLGATKAQAKLEVTKSTLLAGRITNWATRRGSVVINCRCTAQPYII